MNHKVKTPLNAISLSAQILDKELIDIEQRETMKNIIANSKLLHLMVKDLLDFHRD